jgi:hypothetical protein
LGLELVSKRKSRLNFNTREEKLQGKPLVAKLDHLFLRAGNVGINVGVVVMAFLPSGGMRGSFFGIFRQVRSIDSFTDKVIITRW